MTSKTQIERFVGKWQVDNFGTFSLKKKIERKQKLDSFLFKGETKHLKIISSSEPRVRL